MKDLIVIGGGINGAGIARDAALRGLDVTILEKEDWGGGTSSKSSMLAHGGVRYLEQFEMGLVHEALQERERLFQHAPHLVRPQRFVYPIFPDTASRRTVRVGLFLYDLLSHGKSVPKRHYINRKQLLQSHPELVADDLKGGATYYDGQIRSVERLTWELIQDAKQLGVDARNYTEAQLVVENRRCIGVDTPDGRILARAVINAAGPWVDDVLAGRSPPRIRKTKGIHLVVKKFTNDAYIIRATDGRTFFVVPWKDHCIIGTTDTDYAEDPRDAAATSTDVAYMMASAKRYFPHADLRILFTYAGVRPLVNEPGLTESNVTRRHQVVDHAQDQMAGLWSIQGGKITTYRSLSEHAVDIVMKHLGMDSRASTRERTLPGGPLIAWDDFRTHAIAAAQADFKVPPKTAKRVVDTYGAGWRHVLEHDANRIGKRPHVWGEVDHAVQCEDAKTLADVMLRRTDLGLAPGGAMGTAKMVLERISEQLPAANWLADYEHAWRVFAVPDPDTNL